jgi:ABC-type phosphate transport system substrate-binding protein
MRRLSIIAALLLLVLVGAPSGPARADGYRVIVHPGNPVESVDRAFLANVFLKRTTEWPGGGTIRPVDQAADSDARRRFSRGILGRTVAAVRSYWQQIIFSGRGLPPPELASDQAVVRYVSDNPGAVGYVSEAAELGAARPLTVR